MIKKTRRVLKNLALAGLVFLGSHANAGTMPLEQRIEIAKTELATRGITGEQRATYKPGVSEMMRLIFDPSTSYDIPNQLHSLKRNLTRKENNPSVEDAWRLYLGIPQKHNSFGISDFKPSKSKADKYYFKLNNFFGELGKSYSWTDLKMDTEFAFALANGKIEDYGANSPAHNDGRPVYNNFSAHSMTLGQFKLSKGKDTCGKYISYYDKWDLKFPLERSGLIGKPFEVYDRIYYDSSSAGITLNKKCNKSGGKTI